MEREKIALNQSKTPPMTTIMEVRCSHVITMPNKVNFDAEITYQESQTWVKVGSKGELINCSLTVLEAALALAKLDPRKPL